MATEPRFIRTEETWDKLLELADADVVKEVQVRLRFRKYWEARTGTKFVLYDNSPAGPQNIEVLKFGALSMPKGGLLEADLTSNVRSEPVVLHHYPVRLWDRDACLLIAKYFEYEVVAIVRGEGGKTTFFPRVGLLTQEAAQASARKAGVTNLLPLVKFREEFGYAPEY